MVASFPQMPMSIIGPLGQEDVMGIVFFGQSRMAARQPWNVDPRNANVVEDRPTWGLGPRGMPGAVDYLDERAMRQKQPGGIAPNAYEQLGLYWNGSGIVQGRPLRSIEQEQALAEREAGRQDRQTGISAVNTLGSLVPDSQPAAAGVMGIAPPVAPVVSAAQQAERARTGIGQVQALSGLVPSSQPVAAGIMGMPAPAAPLGTVEAAQNSQRIGLAGRQVAQEGVRTLADIAPSGQATAAGIMGLPLPAGAAPMTPARTSKGESPVPTYVSAATLEAVNRAMQVDPKLVESDPRKYERALRDIAGKAGIKDYTADQLKLDLKAYGPMLQADRTQRLAGAGAADGSNVPAALVEAYFQKYGGKIPRDQIRRMVAERQGGAGR
jgi:hypothetical protein